MNVPICDTRVVWTYKCNTTPETIIDRVTCSTLFARVGLSATKNHTVLIHDRCFYQPETVTQRHILVKQEKSVHNKSRKQL